MPTIREELAAGIEFRGGRMIEKRPRRWIMRLHDQHYFIGVSGALRVGASYEHSLSLTGSYAYTRIIREGRAMLAAVKQGNPTCTSQSSISGSLSSVAS